MRMSVRSWCLLGVLSLLWGGAFFFAAIAVRDVPPLTVVLCRVSIAALCLFVLMRTQGEQLPRSRSIYLAFLLMGLLNNVIPFSMLFWAQTSISSGLASILNATTPMFSIIVAHIFLSDERMHANKLAGVVLAMGGVIVLVGGELIGGFGVATLGVLACLGAAFSYGLASVFGRRFARLGIAVKTVAFGQLAASSVIMLPVVIVLDQPWVLPLPSHDAVLSIIALAIASTALAYLIYFHLLATAGAVNVALVTLLIPLSAIFLGACFLDEQLQNHHYAGMLLIASGLLTVDGRVLRRKSLT
jgi:drug/metabolite transporter (DMT)-like permease